MSSDRCDLCAAEPCVCSEELLELANQIFLRKRIRTNYGTGPYLVTKVFGPCRCPEYVDSLGNPDPAMTDLHFHFILKDLRGDRGSSPCYLNQYRLDGTNVVRPDAIEILPDDPDIEVIVPDWNS